MNLPEQLGFETRYFDLPGLRIHAAVAGPDNGPLVILLHGFPEFWYSWRHQIGPLARAGYRVVAPDQRGYNLTGKGAPYDLRTLTTDVTQLMDACGSEKARIAGHDWGGAVAWALAAYRPERVARLAILNAPHAIPFARALRGGSARQMLRSWYVFFFQLRGLAEWSLRWRNFAALQGVLTNTANAGTFTAVDIERYKDSWAQSGALAGMLGWYRAMFRARRGGSGAGRSKPVTVPTILLWGERDAALGVELAVQSAQWLANGKLIRFPDATHWLHEDNPEEITRQLLDHWL